MPVFQPKDQIAYIPTHADRLPHKDVAFGFVTSVRGDTVFCRYWRRDKSGLSTKSTSLGAPVECLVHHKSVPDAQVEEAWTKYVKEEV